MELNYTETKDQSNAYCFFHLESWSSTYCVITDGRHGDESACPGGPSLVNTV